MATEQSILARVRKELGDDSEPFRQTFRGTGSQDEFDLPVARVSATNLKVFTVDKNGNDSTLAADVDFTLDDEDGIVRLTSPLPTDDLLVVEGEAFGMFTDDELFQYVREAVLLHTNGQNNTVRYRNGHGFIVYDRVAKDIANLPEIEELPVAILATINAMYSLYADAATDIDVTSAEGTHIPRSQRFGQLTQAIEILTGRYQQLCAQLNVGLWRIEVSNLRRVSRTTNRLIPLYVEREYDDYANLPIRITPEIDTRDQDPEGPSSPAYQQGIW